MRAKPLTLLAPKPGRRRFWAVLIRDAGRRKQVSTQTLMKAAAREFGRLYVKQYHPTVARLLNERPLKKSVIPIES